MVRCGDVSGKVTRAQLPPDCGPAGRLTVLEKDRSALEEPIQSLKDMGWEGGRLGGEVFGWILGGLGESWDVLVVFGRVLGGLGEVLGAPGGFWGGLREALGPQDRFLIVFVSIMKPVLGPKTNQNRSKIDAKML